MRPDEYATQVRERRAELEVTPKSELVRLARGHVLFLVPPYSQKELVQTILTGEFPHLSWDAIMAAAYPQS